MAKKKKKKGSKSNKKLLKATRRARKATGGERLLSSGERARLLKPPENAEEIAEQAAALVQTAGRRVPSRIRPSQLLRLVAKAKRAQSNEQKFENRIAEKLAGLQDARLVAYDALWRAVLDVNAAANYAERSDEGLRKLFAPLHQNIPGGRSPGASSEPRAAAAAAPSAVG